eukprot:1659676-Pyramimonas_sp.AAC.1
MPSRALEAAAKIRQRAGATVRDAILRVSPFSLHSRAMASRSLARAIWRGDERLLRVFRYHHPWTQSATCFVNGVPQFSDP